MEKYLVKFYDTRTDEFFEENIMFARNEEDLLEHLNNQGQTTRIREKREHEYLDLDDNGDLIKIIQVSHI